jgi:hypothetical protein
MNDLYEKFSQFIKPFLEYFSHIPPSSNLSSIYCTKSIKVITTSNASLKSNENKSTSNASLKSNKNKITSHKIIKF